MDELNVKSAVDIADQINSIIMALSSLRGEYVMLAGLLLIDAKNLLKGYSLGYEIPEELRIPNITHWINDLKQRVAK